MSFSNSNFHRVRASDHKSHTRNRCRERSPWRGRQQKQKRQRSAPTRHTTLPTHKPRAFKPQALKGPTVIGRHGCPRWRHRQVIILCGEGPSIEQERACQRIFKQLNYQVYDHLYPFRLMKDIFLRKRDKMPNVANSLIFEQDLELYLLEAVEKRMEECGISNFFVPYFDQWWNRMSATGKDVVVCGLDEVHGQILAEKYNAEIMYVSEILDGEVQFRNRIATLKAQHAK